MHPPMVKVTWEDARAVADEVWVFNKDHEYKPHIVESVGFLILDVPEGIHLSPAWNPHLIGTPDQIPRGMIKSIEPLEVTKKKGRR